MNHDYPYKLDENYKMIRSNEMNYFTEGVFADIGRSFFISGKLAVIAITNYELQNGTFVNNSNQSLVETMLNGTYNGIYLPFIENATLDDWHGSIKKLAEGLSYNIEVTIHKIELMQEDNFNLNITSLTNILIMDPILSASLNRTIPFSKIISLQDLEDPFNTVLSKGYIHQKYLQCSRIEGSYSSLNWTYGRSYVDFTETNFSAFSFPVNTFLITKNISNVVDFGGFTAVIGETEENTGSVDCISGAANATDFIENNSIIVLDRNYIWITNLTSQSSHSCFFEAKDAPCFLDRIENSSSFSHKYMPGNRGIGSFINILHFPVILQDYSKEGLGDYKLDWKYYPV